MLVTVALEWGCGHTTERIDDDAWIGAMRRWAAKRYCPGCKPVPLLIEDTTAKVDEPTIYRSSATSEVTTID